MNSIHEVAPSLSRLAAELSGTNPLRVPEYLGPETVMPLASILATILGFFLVFWRLIAKTVKKVIRRARGLPDEMPPEVEMEEAPVDESSKTENISTQ